ncbi:efflux RND transporter periplasmic adaptor subunit [Rhodovibrionaceae bacterium A322]
MVKKLLLTLGGGVLAAALSGCLPEDNKNAAAPAAPPASVIVAKVEKQKISPSTNFVGQTEAIESVDLRARVEGYINERLFREGGLVEKDQLLFVLEKDAYVAAVESAKAQVAQAKATLTKTEQDLARSQSLFKRGNVSQATLDDNTAAKLSAEAEVRVMEAALKTAELDLSYTEIHSPIKGKIGRETYSVGNLVSPSSNPLANVISQDPMYVTFSISERLFTESKLKQVEEGKTDIRESDVVPSLRFANHTFYSYVGELEFIDPRVDQTTGTVRVRATFPNPDGVLLPGQFVTVVLQLSEPTDTLLVPQAAVQEDQSGRFVLVVDKDNKIEVRRITVGQRDGIYWAVRDGVTEGEAVVYQGIQKARPGAVVDPVYREPASPDKPASGEPKEGASKS